MNNKAIIIILLSAAVAMAAADQQQDTGPDAEAKQDRSSPVARKEIQERLPADVKWPRPFIPSEEISADSVVSFPADI